MGHTVKCLLKVEEYGTYFIHYQVFGAIHVWQASVVDLPGRKPHWLVEMGECTSIWSYSRLLM